MEDIRDDIEKDNTSIISQKVENSVAEYYDNSLANKRKKIQGLTEKLVEAEIEVKEKQIEGRKQVLKSEIETEVTRAKVKEDEEKQTISIKSKTIMQGKI